MNKKLIVLGSVWIVLLLVFIGWGVVANMVDPLPGMQTDGLKVALWYFLALGGLIPIYFGVRRKRVEEEN